MVLNRPSNGAEIDPHFHSLSWLKFSAKYGKGKSFSLSQLADASVKNGVDQNKTTSSIPSCFELRISKQAQPQIFWTHFLCVCIKRQAGQKYK